jgi:hypothetical protein
VVLWVGQTLVLVASSVLRTFYYIEAYSLTRLRIGALIWMGLVAVGLLLILWRLVRGRSADWLINANAVAALAAMASCSVIDLGGVAAEWNVGHARETGGSGAALDLCYLARLGPSAVVPLSELETRPLPPAFRSQVTQVRAQALAAMIERQSHWRGWVWRDARRLQRARSLYPVQPPTSALLAGVQDCDGALRTAALVPPIHPAPLTHVHAG